MERVAILLITSFLTLPYIVRGYKEFELNFPHSTNKVIVTDLYYALEYSIFRGIYKTQVEVVTTFNLSM